MIFIELIIVTILHIIYSQHSFSLLFRDGVASIKINMYWCIVIWNSYEFFLHSYVSIINVVVICIIVKEKLFY